MKKTLTSKLLLPLSAIVFIGIGACKKEYSEVNQTLKELYRQYQNGDISECMHKGELVYSAGLNAYDAGGVIYDKKGKQIGICNFNEHLVDPICSELTDCETIYMVENNIWGRPAVDKYGLKYLDLSPERR